MVPADAAAGRQIREGRQGQAAPGHGEAPGIGELRAVVHHVHHKTGRMGQPGRLQRHMAAAAEQQHRRRVQGLHITFHKAFPHQTGTALAPGQQGPHGLRARVQARHQGLAFGQGIQIQVAHGRVGPAHVQQPDAGQPGFQGRVRRTEQGRLRRRQIFTEQIHAAAADHVAVGAESGEVTAHTGGAPFPQADIGRLHGAGLQQAAAHGAFQSGGGQQGAGTGGTRGRAFPFHHGQQDHGLPFVQQPGRTGLQIQRYAQAIHRGAHQHRRGRRFRHPIHRRLLSHSRSPWWGT